MRKYEKHCEECAGQFDPCDQCLRGGCQCLGCRLDRRRKEAKRQDEEEMSDFVSWYEGTREVEEKTVILEIQEPLPENVIRVDFISKKRVA